MVEDRKLYKYHSENLKSLDKALTHTSLQIKNAIRIKQEQQIVLFNRLYAFILGAWAEVRLRKLLYEPGGFPIAIRSKVEEKDTLFNKWIECIDQAFCHKYQEKVSRLPRTTKLRYEAIKKYMRDHLEPTITTRNKLAHGQWIYPLNHDLAAVDSETMRIFQRQNIKNLQEQKKMLNAIASLVNDLVVSRPTFERDFDPHFKRIDDIERDLSTRSYEAYKQNLINRHERGKLKRTLNNK